MGVKISVVIVCFNEIKNIEACLTSVSSQDYAKNDYEIIVVDNNSNDGTADIIRKYSSANVNLRMTSNAVRNIARSRNIGVKAAKYPVVAFLDADCVAPVDWLSKYAAAYERLAENRNDVAGIAGGNKPPHDTRFYIALSIMLDSFIGSRGSIQGMRHKVEREVGHIPCVNALFKKDAILSVGRFDESMGNIGEDQDLTYRLKMKKYRFFYMPDNEVIHKMRGDLFRWTKNMFIYGKGRMWLIRKHPSMLSWCFIVPIVLSFLSVAFFFSFPCAVMFFLYLAAIAVVSAFALLKRKNISVFPVLFCLYIFTHLAYGFGEIYGLIVDRGKI